MSWWKELKGKIKINEPLEKHTTFKIGGPCRYFIEPKDEGDLKLLLNLLKRYKIPFLVIGAGSNILANDKKIEAAVIHLSSPAFKKISLKEGLLEAGAGVLLSQLIIYAGNKGLSGHEFLVGIPGTVGGALAMNAGRGKNRQAMLDLVEKVSVMDYNGNIKALDKKGLKPGYRKSSFSRYIILSTQIKLIKSDKRQVQNRISAYLDYRKATQDYQAPSAGCIFKNPPRSAAAGRLIDLSGLKGKGMGGACISEKHANFIVNRGKAKARDVLKLMAMIRKEVKKKFKINLEPEIKVWQ